MKGNYVDAEVKKSMSEILQRLHTLEVKESCEAAMEDLPDEADDHATELLSSLSPSAVHLMCEMEARNQYDFHTLPVADQCELTHLFTSDARGSVVSAWRPWWHGPEASQIRLNRHGQGLVVAVSSQTGDGESSGGTSQSNMRPYTAPPSPPAKAIPHLSALTEADPHPQLYLSLLETLFAYCSALYLYNGDPDGDLPGYIDLLWHLAPHLWQTTTDSTLPATLTDAVTTSIKRLDYVNGSSVAGPSADECRLGHWAWSSVASICACGRGAAVCAIADLNRQHKDAHKEWYSTQHAGMHFSRRLELLATRKLKYGMLKAQFQLSFSNSRADAQYAMWGHSIRNILEAEFKNAPLDNILQALIISSDNKTAVATRNVRSVSQIE